ncbi:MAG: SpoIIE family protein phosphatase [Actinomycetes bacterium]
MTLPPAETSVAQARGLVSRTLAQWGADELVDDAVLLVSELVTNAVVHAGTDVEVTLLLQAEAVEVAVTDRHPARTVPAPPAAVGDDREDGRGLLLTAALASSWGVEYTGRAKRVWFRLPLMVPLPSLRAGTVVEAGPGGDHPAAAVGMVLLDRDGLVLRADDSAAALLGRPPAELTGASWLSLCVPDDVGTLLTAAAAGRWQGSYAVSRADGRTLQVHARHVRLRGGREEGDETVVVLVDHRLRVLLADHALAHTTAAVADGPFASSPEALLRLELDAVLERTVMWARDALGGDGGYALLVTDDDGELELRTVAGLRPIGDRATLPVADAGGGRPGGDVVPVVHHDLADGRTRGAAWLEGSGMRSLVAVPVLAEGRLIGTVGVTSRRTSAFTADDGARLQRAVDAIALAVQSARVAELERWRHGWLGYLAEAGELLAGTLDLDMALVLVAQLVAPQLGPWCAVHLVDETGRWAEGTVWHADEERLEDLRRLFASTPPPIPAARGLSRWAPDLQGADADNRDLAEAGGHVIPLVARGRVLGALTVGHTTTPQAERGRRQHLHLLEDLAPRAALALDNARLYAERTASSEALQTSLLPPDLPVLPGVDVGVVYEATGVGNEVGGDFFDVFRMAGAAGADGERFAFAVGDVCGKGPAAAAVTGLGRNALRLLGRRGDSIDTVLSQLNAAILAEGPRARFMTVVYGEGERTADGGLDLRFASAGHPAPVVVRVDGTAEPVGESGDLLGVFEEPATRVNSVRLEPGECLVCYTDGVTERRHGTVMLGEEGVLRALRGGSQMSATALARRLGTTVTEFAAEPGRDDVAILVLRAAPGNSVRPPQPAG